MHARPPLLPHLAHRFEHYLTLERIHPSKTYSYRARGFFLLPVVEYTQHAPKCKNGESWMYVAIPERTSLYQLGSEERLYVGAQTQDRMFRGDGCKGSNYHHSEMRSGKGADNPIAFLNTGRSIEIHRIGEDSIRDQIASTEALAPLSVLLDQPITARRHVGWWLEQYLLLTEPGQWRWNTAMADRAVAAALAA